MAFQRKIGLTAMDEQNTRHSSTNSSTRTRQTSPHTILDFRLLPTKMPQSDAVYCGHQNTQAAF
jgi:hypothetical protein